MSTMPVASNHQMLMYGNDAGGQESDAIMSALIHMAGYPAQDIATMAVPFWQLYTSLVSQSVQVCSVPPPNLAV